VAIVIVVDVVVASVVGTVNVDMFNYVQVLAIGVIVVPAAAFRENSVAIVTFFTLNGFAAPIDLIAIF
jgi:galactitol-specific phosphotransferase system IIC component